MKVKVRVITPPYDDVPTESLQAILRNHAHDKLQIQIGTKQLFDIMGELTRRRDASGMPSRSTEEAWAEFVKHYLPEAEPSEEALLQALQTPHELTPSPGGRSVWVMEIGRDTPASAPTATGMRRYVSRIGKSKDNKKSPTGVATSDRGNPPNHLTRRLGGVVIIPPFL